MGIRISERWLRGAGFNDFSGFLRGLDLDIDDSQGAIKEKLTFVFNIKGYSEAIDLDYLSLIIYENLEHIIEDTEGGLELQEDTADLLKQKNFGFGANDLDSFLKYHWKNKEIPISVQVL